MKARILVCLLLIISLLAPTASYARWMNPSTGRFHTMDAFEGRQTDPQSIHKYLYAADDPVNQIDPSGHAAYFIERQFAGDDGPAAWANGFGHGYLLFTPTSDRGVGDPWEARQTAVRSFSWHPYRWDYTSEDKQVPGRVWESHPKDLNPGPLHSAFLVTTDAAQQAALLNFIRSWIQAARPGYDRGDPRPEPGNPRSEIGMDEHIDAPPSGVYYSLREQNCVWWATIMLKQSNINVPVGVYAAAASFNHGVGAASLVVCGQRSATDVRTLRGIPYGQFRMPVVLNIDLSSFGLAP